MIDTVVETSSRRWSCIQVAYKGWHVSLIGDDFDTTPDMKTGKNISICPPRVRFTVSLGFSLGSGSGLWFGDRVRAMARVRATVMVMVSTVRGHSLGSFWPA